MNAERFLAEFSRVADAPDAVPRLRRFVLDLAVRGKLVPQDSGDEPASALLKRIAAQKARLVKAGKVRKQPNSSLIRPDETPNQRSGSMGVAAVARHWRAIGRDDTVNEPVGFLGRRCRLVITKGYQG